MDDYSFEHFVEHVACIVEFTITKQRGSKNWASLQFNHTYSASIPTQVEDLAYNNTKRINRNNQSNKHDNQTLNNQKQTKEEKRARTWN